MKPASLLRWYPRAWRERYGEELLALIQDTLEEGRPTWRLRLGVIRGGLRERGHQAWRAMRAAATWRTVLDRWTLFMTGLVLASLPEAVTVSLPQPRGWPALAADAMLAAVALTGVTVLASGLMILPALIGFLRAGGWPKVRRQIMRAAVATAVAAGILAGLSAAADSRSYAQQSASWFFFGRQAAGVAIAVAIGLWAAAAAATARHLTLTPRARAAQLVLGPVIQTMALAMFIALTLWWSANQSSVLLLVMSLVNLAGGIVFVPPLVSRAVRKGRRLRAAASGGPTINPSAQRTNGRHRA